jgi:DNA-binding NarL/FixJ family response regulator
VNRAATVPAVTLSRHRARRLARAGQQVDAALEARNQEIRDAASEGGTLREIAEAVGLSFAGVKKILDRDRS